MISIQAINEPRHTPREKCRITLFVVTLEYKKVVEGINHTRTHNKGEQVFVLCRSSFLCALWMNDRRERKTRHAIIVVLSDEKRSEEVLVLFFSLRRDDDATTRRRDDICLFGTLAGGTNENLRGFQLLTLIVLN